jgi:hypothetical protein
LPHENSPKLTHDALKQTSRTSTKKIVEENEKLHACIDQLHISMIAANATFSG